MSRTEFSIQPVAVPTLDETFTVAINVAVVGPTTLFAAVPDRRWRATTLVLVATAAVTVQLNSGANVIAGPMALAANIPLVVVGDAANNILRATNVNEALTITLGAAIQVGGWIQLQVPGER